MLNRVSLRKSAQRDGNLDASSTEDLQRRQNILKAIDDSLSHRESPPGNKKFFFLCKLRFYVGSGYPDIGDRPILNFDILQLKTIMKCLELFVLI